MSNPTQQRKSVERCHKHVIKSICTIVRSGQTFQFPQQSQMIMLTGKILHTKS